MLRPLSFTHKQRGFSLVEMMITGAISLILLGAVLYIYSQGEKQNITNLKLLTLNNQMRDIMSLMVRDIRRAGYWGGANGSPTNTNNPYTQGSKSYSINADKNCILLSYDANANGSAPSLGTGSDDERYGYRLKGGIVQARISNVNNSCDIDDGWIDISDAKTVKILSLVFTDDPTAIDLDGSGPKTSALTINSINIAMQGEFSTDKSMQLSLATKVRARNDVYTP